MTELLLLLFCLQMSLRQFAMPRPDMNVIIEVHLCRLGLRHYRTLAAKLSILTRLLQTQVYTTSAALCLHDPRVKVFVSSMLKYIGTFS